MGLPYLDRDGLARLWTKIKALAATDKTLTRSDTPADAAAVGDRLTALEESGGGGCLGVYSIALTTDGWTACTDVTGYGYKFTAALADADETIIPSAVPTPDTLTTAISAGLAPICETAAASVIFWAESVPTGDIQMQVSLWPTGSASTDALGEAALGDMTL